MPLFSNPEKDLQKAHFDLKFASKQMERNALKAEKDQKKEEAKIKKAIQDGQTEKARIFAESAIRKKNEALNFHRMSGRLDAVSQRIQTAITMKQVSKSMGTASKGMDKALQSMDLQKITAIMDKFETQFDDLDVQTGVMSNAMSGIASGSTPENEVDALINNVVDAHGLNVAHDLDMPVADQTPSLSHEEEAALSDRLKALRAMED